jgi:hypothetical protein
MEFSEHYIHSICKNFEAGGDIILSTVPASFTESQNGIYLKAEITEFDKNFCIPILLYRHMRKIVLERLHNDNSQINYKAIANLKECFTTGQYKTINTIVTTILGQTYPRYELIKLQQTNTDNLYYGNNGLILDKNFKPLILLTIICSVHNDSTIHVKGYKVFVDTSVLIDKTDPMKKHILSRILPVWCNPEILRRYYNYLPRLCDTVPSNITSKVTVDFCDFKEKFFSVVKAPNNVLLETSNVDELVDEILQNNIEEIADITRKNNIY